MTTIPSLPQDDLVARLREAYEAAKYQPGDYSIMPIRVAAFMEMCSEIIPALPSPLPPSEIERRLLSFLSHRYVQRADDRQKAMGLVYMEAETHYLAKQLARFVPTLAASTPSDPATVREAGLREGQPITYNNDGMVFKATFIEDVEGWYNIRFNADNSTAIVRPSRVKALSLIEDKSDEK